MAKLQRVSVSVTLKENHCLTHAHRFSNDVHLFRRATRFLIVPAPSNVSLRLSLRSRKSKFLQRKRRPRGCRNATFAWLVKNPPSSPSVCSPRGRNSEPRCGRENRSERDADGERRTPPVTRYPHVQGDASRLERVLGTTLVDQRSPRSALSFDEAWFCSSSSVLEMRAS
jgi:hypothetical protein